MEEEGSYLKLGEYVRRSKSIAEEVMLGHIHEARKKNQLLGQHLCEEGLITKEELRQALDFQKEHKKDWRRRHNELNEKLSQVKSHAVRRKGISHSPLVVSFIIATLLSLFAKRGTIHALAFLENQGSGDIWEVFLHAFSSVGLLAFFLFSFLAYDYVLTFRAADLAKYRNWKRIWRWTIAFMIAGSLFLLCFLILNIIYPMKVFEARPQLNKVYAFCVWLFMASLFGCAYFFQVAELKAFRPKGAETP